MLKCHDIQYLKGGNGVYQRMESKTEAKEKKILNGYKENILYKPHISLHGKHGNINGLCLHRIMEK